MSDASQAEVGFDEVGSRRICIHCVGELYLMTEMIQSGSEADCHYCGKRDKTWPVAELADRVEKAFEQHFERTSENPTAFESMLQNDPDSTYNWHREGEETVYAIAEAARVDENIAEDVQGILADRHFDFEDAKMGVESEFAKDAQYAEKATDDAELQSEWHHFEREVRMEARFFSTSAQAILGRIFGGLNTHRTRKGRPVIVRAGPGRSLTSFFRARVFQSQSKLETALLRPDLEIGPPRDWQARPGRMNAAGISVFYGARKRLTALSEVRPPVGSGVVIARFDLLREVRLLDVGALQDVFVEGSFFDPEYLQRLEHAKFLGTLSGRIARVVMPDDEASGYLVTQLIADYLANVVKLDGLLYQSVQQGAAAGNVVLFRHASRVEPLDLPPGTKLQASLYHSTEDGDEPDYTVYEEVPDTPAGNEQEVNPMPDPFAPLDFTADIRPVTLKLVPGTVEVCSVQAATYKSQVHKVRRHRLKLPPGQKDFF